MPGAYARFIHLYLKMRNILDLLASFAQVTCSSSAIHAREFTSFPLANKTRVIASLHQVSCILFTLTILHSPGCEHSKALLVKLASALDTF